MPWLLIEHIQVQRRYTTDSHFSQQITRWCHTSQFSSFLVKKTVLTRSKTSAKCRLSLCSLFRILSISHWRSSIIVSRTDTRDSAVSTLSCSLENCNQKSVSASRLNTINMFWDCSILIFLSFFIFWIRVVSTQLLLWQQTTQWTVLYYSLAESKHSNENNTKLKVGREQETSNISQSADEPTSAYSKVWFF